MSKQIDYRIVLEDIEAFSVHHARTSKLWRRRMLFSQTCGLLATLIFALIWPRWSIVERVLFFAGLSFFWLVVYPTGYRWEIKRNARKIYAGGQGKGIIGEHTIIIDPEGVTERSAVGESRTAWSGVERVDDDNQNIYLFVGPIQAHVIPKRAFENSDDANAFLQMAQAYRLARVQSSQNFATGADE